MPLESSNGVKSEFLIFYLYKLHQYHSQYPEALSAYHNVLHRLSATFLMEEDGRIGVPDFSRNNVW